MQGSGHAGAGAPHSLPAPSPGRPRAGRGVPLAPGSGGLAMMHRACRGHGGSQPGLRMVKCEDVERRQWGAPGAWGLEEASEKTWIMASLSIWLLLSPPAMPTAHFWDLLSEGCLWIPDSRSGPCLAQRHVKGCGATNRRLIGKDGGRSAGPTRPAGSWSSFSLLKPDLGSPCLSYAFYIIGAWNEFPGPILVLTWGTRCSPDPCP